MSLAEHGLFDAARARTAIHPGIEFYRGWNLDSDPVWSRDTDAVLRIDAARFAQPVALAIRIRTFNPDTATPKTLQIASPGHDTVAVRITRTGVQTVLVRTPVMAQDATSGFVTLSLESPQSPAQLGLSRDDRLLGFHIIDIREDVVPLTLPLDLRDPKTSTEVLASGWDRIEEGTGVWSLTAAPQIALPGHLDLADVPALAFELDTLPRPRDHPPLQIELWSAGRRLVVWDFAQSTSGTWICPVVHSPTGQGFEITFRINALASPAMLGINADPRMLGLLLRSIAPAEMPEQVSEGP
jgi:hypothetical protein